jgi:hypothetical protein
MGAVRYLFALLVAVASGFIGGALSGPIGAALLTQFVQPRQVQARKAFVIIDKEGKRRAVLDQTGLTFFNEQEGTVAVLDGQGLSLTGAEPGTNTYSRVQVSPTDSAVITFSHGRGASWPLSPWNPSVPPKLGIGIVAGKIVWSVPPDAERTEQSMPQGLPAAPSTRSQ